MVKIGFLACDTTMPGAPNRRADAHEHDLMVAALEPSMASHGMAMEVIDWESPISAFDGIDLVMLGTVWNYQDKAEAFLTRLEELAARGIQVCNPPDLVRWNANKTYLRKLEEAGARIIPTLWQGVVGRTEVAEAFYYFDCEQLVVKRQVGAGAEGQMLIAKDALPGEDWRYGHAAMLQPFLPAITREGELSFIFIDGEFSHALRKSAPQGEYRIQSLYGGTEAVYIPTEDETQQARAVIDNLPFDTPLYARIDMLRSDTGRLLLMEAEMIEPYLYPEQGPQLGEYLARAIAHRVSERMPSNA